MIRSIQFIKDNDMVFSINDVQLWYKIETSSCHMSQVRDNNVTHVNKIWL